MKKHNEGYTLVLVAVMLTAICLLFSVILAASLRNLNFQQTAAQRMSDKYAVRGQVDRIVMQLEAMKGLGSGEIELKSDPDAGLQILVIDGYIVIRARSGQIQADCVLLLENASITSLNNDGKYKITGLTGVEYALYEVYTAEEVAGDGQKPDEDMEVPGDAGNLWVPEQAGT